MSWTPETQDDSGDWMGHLALRFATKEEAEQYINDYAGRWYAVTRGRVVENAHRVNYKYVDGKLIHIKVDRQEEGFV